MSELANAAQLEERLRRQLALLPLIRRSLSGYYQALSNEPQEPLRIAALIALLDLKAVWSTQAEFVIANAHRRAVRMRAFPFFLSVFGYEFATRVARTLETDAAATLSARMEAELSHDYLRMAELDLELYMADGVPEHLRDAQINAERGGGWRASVPMSLINLLARPMDHSAPYYLLFMLNSANQPKLVEAVCDAFDVAQLYKSESGIFRASLAADAGDAKGALKILDKVPNAINPIAQAHALQLRGDILAKLGSYREAHNAFQRMNKVTVAATVDPKTFYSSVDLRARYDFEGDQADTRVFNHAIMLGFPRSGTTLLENALGAHPEIKTVEEPPTLKRMARWLERFAPKDGQIPEPVAREARDAYFDELQRQSGVNTKPFTIDKLPIASADAVFLKKIMPGMRYIFSIRHPYDVVLSCFRQNFVTNTAMENFRSIDDGARLYDFAMTKWFSVHSLDDEAGVCYVRYEDLVQAFRPTLERVIDFIGVRWDDQVLNFVEAADRRHAKTPSYKKVRSGLSIGVQSSRDNYKFLFDMKETAVLKKWVKHFGYDT